MQTIHAIYENGVFRPTEKVDLPEQSEVEIELRVVDKSEDLSHLHRIREMLAARFDSGQSDLAERHDEHQP